MRCHMSFRVDVTASNRRKTPVDSEPNKRDKIPFSSVRHLQHEVFIQEHMLAYIFAYAFRRRAFWMQISQH